MDAELEMTVRALLLRLRSLMPDSQTLQIQGITCDTALLDSTGWKVSENPDVLLLWHQPIPSDSTAKLICRIGENEDQPVATSYGKIADQSFSLYASLNTWFALTFDKLPRSLLNGCTRLFRVAKLNEVVGTRMCKLRHRSWRQQIFLKKDVPKPIAMRESTGDRVRDLAMTFFGIGYTPLFAANTASLVVTLLAFGLWHAGGASVLLCGLILALLLSTVGCVLFEPWATKRYLTEDAREVVLDEVAGMSLTLLFLFVGNVLGGLGFLIAFLAFRFFDIFKPGIHWIEETGWRGTIVWDDLLAGLFAGITAFAGVKVLALMHVPFFL